MLSTMVAIQMGDQEGLKGNTNIFALPSSITFPALNEPHLLCSELLYPSE